jgi:hypothetical protein
MTFDQWLQVGRTLLAVIPMAAGLVLIIAEAKSRAITSKAALAQSKAHEQRERAVAERAVAHATLTRIVDETPPDQLAEKLRPLQEAEMETQAEPTEEEKKEATKEREFWGTVEKAFNREPHLVTGILLLVIPLFLLMGYGISPSGVSQPG